MAIEIELPDGTILEAPDDADPGAVAKAYLARQQQAEPQPEMTPEQSAVAQQSPSFAAQLASAAVRPIVKGITAVPGVFADGTMAAWNLATGQRNEMPTAATNRLLDQYTLKPEGAGKAAEIVSSALVGSRVPVPQMGAQAPAGFAGTPVEQMIRTETLRRGQAAGYVVPPATSNPTMVNRVMEGAAGKVTTAQAAASRNQEITNQLARRAVGLGVDDQISPQALRAIRNDAGAVYRAIGRTGEIVTDAQYVDELNAMTGQVDDIARAFPRANVGARRQITELIESLDERRFDSRAALEFVKQLRNEAKGNLSRLAAADPSRRALGTAQRRAADILEGQIERHLNANGHEVLARSFGNARQLIARTHTVESALNRGTGNVSATKIAAQADKGAPVNGELGLIADFTRAFPKVAREYNESLPGVSPWDFGWGGVGSAATGNPALMAYPFARMGLRSFMLSPQGQRFAAEGVGSVPPGALMGAIPPIQELGQ